MNGVSEARSGTDTESTLPFRLICKALLSIVSLFYILYISVAGIIYLFYLPFLLSYFLATGKGKLDDTFRIYNRRFGIYMVRVSWPFIRVKMNSSAHLKRGVSYIVVTNHRTYADVFFSALIPIYNQVATVRSWPFDLKVFGWSMRLAKYIDIERTSLEDLSEIGGYFKERLVSILFYPEGHRSPDGRLQRFRKGAFKLAVENNQPVLPVCMTGSEKFATREFPFLHPMQINIHVMEPIQPSVVESGEDQIAELRNLVENKFRTYLGE